MWLKLSDEQYFGAENAYGSSDLKRALASPAHVKIKSDPTPAMARGTLIHSVLLENKPFVRMPDFNARTNAGKADKQAFLNQNKGALIASQNDVEILNAIKKSIQNHPQAKKLLWELEGEIEESALVQDDNILRRIKLDKRMSKLGTIIDVKTTNDASGDSFARSATNFMYFLQAAYYLDTANIVEQKNVYESFVFVVVETSAPFGIRVFEVDKTGIELGREQYTKALKIIKNCVKNNDWNSYQNEIEILVPPAYAMYWS